ncbi:hypothetical protein LX36DRAFT_675364 [Colletotrichum falcatum]|nr:hypothetical protein LX36DRAFT_675364 [Colletotrichum falcatum]
MLLLVLNNYRESKVINYIVLKVYLEIHLLNTLVVALVFKITLKKIIYYRLYLKALKELQSINNIIKYNFLYYVQYESMLYKLKIYPLRPVLSIISKGYRIKVYKVIN